MVEVLQLALVDVGGVEAHAAAGGGGRVRTRLHLLELALADIGGTWLWMVASGEEEGGEVHDHRRSDST